MCGFVGYVGEPLPTTLVEGARDLLRHRGPDSAGAWTDRFEGGGVGMGFARLKILDLSPAGEQPMSYGSLHAVFNGEIYNFRELRRELETLGHAFRSSGDTEVLLAAFAEWGDDAILRIEGMFAFALWDARTRRLVLGRDRLGIKPLYYSVQGDRLVFASEPKAVLLLGDLPARLDERSLTRFLTFLWVPDPDTMFQGVKKLPPGHLGVYEGADLSVRAYWEPRFEAEGLSDEEHVERVRASLLGAVHRQLTSDVPLGTFLSGGVDSSLITSLAAGEGSGELLAIAAGFDGGAWRNEPGHDDLPFARMVAAAHPRLDYREVRVSSVSAEASVALADSLDDPVADPAAIATFLICRAAKGHATVMLSGVGAEELFGGYPRHRAVVAAARLAALPKGVRSPLRAAGSAIPGARAGAGMGRLRHARKFLVALGEDDPYIGFVAHHSAESLSALLDRPVDWTDVTAAHRRHLDAARGLSPLSRALYLDLKTFLPCLNLAYTDRASMAASVEVRVPMLDERVVETALRLPDSLKVRGGTGKVALRAAAEGIVPQAVLTRPKTGFGAPVRTWMKEFSSDVIRDCLSPEVVRRRGLFAPAAVDGMRRDLVAGRSDEALQLWALVTFELWARRFLDRTPSYAA